MRGERCGARTDVYGLGATFYELITGAPPFQGDSPALIYRKVLEEEPTPANERNPEVSRDLAAVVSRAMSKARRSTRWWLGNSSYFEVAS